MSHRMDKDLNMKKNVPLQNSRTLQNSYTYSVAIEAHNNFKHWNLKDVGPHPFPFPSPSLRAKHFSKGF